MQCTSVTFYCSQDGLTPLIVAAQNNHTEIVKKLLDAGAEVNDREEVFISS